jgi:hypothetical protein
LASPIHLPVIAIRTCTTRNPQISLEESKSSYIRKDAEPFTALHLNKINTLTLQPSAAMLQLIPENPYAMP